jgi:3-oxoacyl-[acyl-carrier-protein] synthase-3
MYQRVLVVGSETLSRITNWRDRATCVLFGDGAGAAVVGPVEDGGGFLSFDLGTDGSGGEQLAVVRGGWGHPLSTGSEEELYRSIHMDGKKVFVFAVEILESSTRRAMDQAGLSVDDIDLLVPHQANTRIIDAAAKRLQMDESRVYSNVERYGNTSAASIPIALVEARAEGRLKTGQTVVLCGFGAGLSWASCVLRWGRG